MLNVILMKTPRRSKKPLPGRAAAAFDRITDAAAPHMILLILALAVVAIFQRM
jgi:hypothetical protein